MLQELRFVASQVELAGCWVVTGRCRVCWVLLAQEGSRAYDRSWVATCDNMRHSACVAVSHPSSTRSTLQVPPRPPYEALSQLGVLQKW